jgi:hypothetical protein
MAKTRAWKQERHKKRLEKRNEKQNRTARLQRARNQRRALKSQIWGIPAPLRVEAPKPALLLIDRAKIHEWTGAALRKDEPMEATKAA